MAEGIGMTAGQLNSRPRGHLDPEPGLGRWAALPTAYADAPASGGAADPCHTAHAPGNVPIAVPIIGHTGQK